MVLHLEYDPIGDPDVLDWAGEVLDLHSDRTAILSSHYLLGTDGTFSTQGLITYEALKHHDNLLLMQAGHLTGESWRADTYDGHTVYTLLADYQFWANGGDGWMRILEFQPTEDRIEVITWSPTLGEYETDLDSSFELPFRMAHADMDLLGEVTDVEAGSEVELAWPDLEVGTTYMWTVEVSDGQTTNGQTWVFTAGEEVVGDDDDSASPDGADDDDDDCSCRVEGRTGTGQAVVLVLLGALAHRRR